MSQANPEHGLDQSPPDQDLLQLPDGDITLGRVARPIANEHSVAVFQIFLEERVPGQDAEVATTASKAPELVVHQAAVHH